MPWADAYELPRTPRENTGGPLPRDLADIRVSHDCDSLDNLRKQSGGAHNMDIDISTISAAATASKTAVDTLKSIFSAREKWGRNAR